MLLTIAIISILTAFGFSALGTARLASQITQNMASLGLLGLLRDHFFEKEIFSDSIQSLFIF
ncbi:MAG: hypothetical protein B9S32_03630 [Verrucomicrobia bacterium Tous-C9LFEB]|nr:MAG: hypothetical protein B9S32_03630 [Verrucomicrobia bacterium Tous-C9LFEB]